MTANMRPADRKLWEDETSEPTAQEQTLHLAEHADIELAYAMKQLDNARQCTINPTTLDCVSRAYDALERAIEATKQIGKLNAAASAQGPEEWTVEERLAHAG